MQPRRVVDPDVDAAPVVDDARGERLDRVRVRPLSHRDEEGR
jgi:hypothetical protein